MPLQLVTGPANAEKARVVLDGVRAAAHAGRAPLLVVPTFADLQEYRRELAAGGLVFGARVERFAGLERLIAAAVTHAGARPSRTLARPGRRRVAAAAVAATGLGELAEAASTAGFVGALVRLFDELAEQRVAPGRWIAAMRDWGAADPGRAAFADELGRLHGAYADRLRALGRVHPATRSYEAHDALREAPAAWDGTPVFLYGFDDLTAVERDAVATLVEAGAEVVVSLPFEEGRDDVYRARAGTLRALAALAGDWRRLPPLASAGALDHLERTLFGTAADRPDPGRALGLLAGGGERAELELVAAEVAGAIAGGSAPDEIAVAIRDLETSAPLVEGVFADAGIPIALERRVPLDRTGLGRSVVALLRAALPGGTPGDLLAWLRAPGLLERPDLADRLEREIRVRGLRDVPAAEAAWAQINPRFELHELERVRTPAVRGDIPALCDALVAEAERLFAAPWRGTGAVLSGPPAADARALAALRRLLRELADLARRDAALAPAPAELADLLRAETIWIGTPPHPGAVTVADPLRLRARRVSLLVLARMQEGVFPQSSRPEPFLGDAERRALRAASGLRLPLREEALDAERYLLYAAVSRPRERLVLSWHAGDDAGEPDVRSLFVDDVLDCFDPALAARRRVRRLGELDWPEPVTASRRQRALAAALAEGAENPGQPDLGGPGALTDEGVLAELRGRAAWSARALELWAGCPVKWFVEAHLRPDALEPDPEALARGELAHAVLQRALQELGRPVDAGTLDEARRLAIGALAELAPTARLPMSPTRRDAVLGRLEVDVLRYLDFLAAAGSSFAPAHFELGFGTERDEHGPVEIAPGVRISGRIDRIDLDAGGTSAIVVDYKGRAKQPPQKAWEEKGRLQAGLYAIALPELLGVEAAGALYQPIGAKDQRPRGFLRRDADAARTDIVSRDRVCEEREAELLEAVRAAAARAVGEIRAGALEPRPATCGWQGGCAYPSICRCEGA